MKSDNTYWLMMLSYISKALKMPLNTDFGINERQDYKIGTVWGWYLQEGEVEWRG
jgi:hypothetical protein